MTPQERQLVTELFERLATLENKPRDPEAERLITQGLRVAPNAAYALVQTVLVQDQALREADARIRALDDGGAPERDESFLGSMRDALFGSSQERRGSVPSIRTGGDSGRAGGFARQPMEPQQQQQVSQGPSFLGTAAASAAGVIGGALLLDSFRSMMGSRNNANAFGDNNSQSPWNEASGGDSRGGDLARDAGLNDIERGGERNQSGFFDSGDGSSGAEDFADSGDFDLGDSDFS